eukprot:g17278.t1
METQSTTSSEYMLRPELGAIIVDHYEGGFDENGCYSGQGEAIFRSGNTYSGEFRRGVMDGRGRYTWLSDGTVYEGDLRKNELVGEGRYTWSNGSSYVGGVVGGLRNGYGIFTGADGTLVYEGSWKMSKRHGHGEQRYGVGTKDVSTYAGDWHENCRHGRGTMTYASGNVYEGAWVKDRKEGKGTMNWVERRERYTGDWKQDLQCGYGEHVWIEERPVSSVSMDTQKQMCNVYRGEWLDGMRHGQDDGHPELSAAVKLKIDDILGLADEATRAAAVRDVERSALQINSDLKFLYKHYAKPETSAPRESTMFTMSMEQFMVFARDCQALAPSTPVTVGEVYRMFFRMRRQHELELNQSLERANKAGEPTCSSSIGRPPSGTPSRKGSNGGGDRGGQRGYRNSSSNSSVGSHEQPLSVSPSGPETEGGTAVGGGAGRAGGKGGGSGGGSSRGGREAGGAGAPRRGVGSTAASKRGQEEASPEESTRVGDLSEIEGQVSRLYHNYSGPILVPMTLRSLLRMVIRDADLTRRAGLTSEDVKQVFEQATAFLRSQDVVGSTTPEDFRLTTQTAAATTEPVVQERKGSVLGELRGASAGGVVGGAAGAGGLPLPTVDSATVCLANATPSAVNLDLLDQELMPDEFKVVLSGLFELARVKVAPPSSTTIATAAPGLELSSDEPVGSGGPDPVPLDASGGAGGDGGKKEPATSRVNIVETNFGTQPVATTEETAGSPTETAIATAGQEDGDQGNSSALPFGEGGRDGAPRSEVRTAPPDWLADPKAFVSRVLQWAEEGNVKRSKIVQTKPPTRVFPL